MIWRCLEVDWSLHKLNFFYNKLIKTANFNSAAFILIFNLFHINYQILIFTTFPIFNHLIINNVCFDSSSLCACHSYISAYRSFANSTKTDSKCTQISMRRPNNKQWLNTIIWKLQQLYVLHRNKYWNTIPNFSVSIWYRKLDIMGSNKNNKSPRI